MSLRGIDTANVNSQSTVDNAIPSHDFVIAKATEGLHFNDTEYPHTRSVALADGKLFGGYHFAWPAQDPTGEAQHFLAYANPQPGDVIGLDMEKQNDGATWQRRVFYALTWLDYVAAKTGARPVLYINQYWRTQMWAAATPDQQARLRSYPLWLADYTGSPDRVGSPGAWPFVTFEQWTDNEGNLDGDVMPQDARGWAAIAVPGAKPGSPLWKYMAALAAIGVVVGGYLSGGFVHPASDSTPPPPSVSSGQGSSGSGSSTYVPPRYYPPSPTQVPGGSGPVVVVRPGDTLGAIAARNGTTVAALAQANGISNPNRIYVGERIRIRRAAGPVVRSGSRGYSVRSGDTLSAIGRRLGVSWLSLARANGIRPPYRIYPGERLRLSGGPAAPAKAAVRKASPGSVTVRSGDTLSAIAHRYGTTVAHLAAVNHLKNPNRIYAGQTIRLH